MMFGLPGREHVGVIDWREFIASSIPDDPTDTSPILQGHFAALRLACLGKNFLMAGALEKARLRGVQTGMHYSEESPRGKAPWEPNLDGVAAPDDF